MEFKQIMQTIKQTNIEYWEIKSLILSNPKQIKHENALKIRKYMNLIETIMKKL